MKLPINASFALHYEIEGEGIPLLLLHGFTGTLNTWQGFVGEWDTHFQLIMVDVVGHGKSLVNEDQAHSASFYTMEAMSEALIQLLDHLQLEKILVLGYSMGARLALYLATHYPERLSGLVLESGSPGLRTAEEQESRRRSDEALAERILKEGVVPFVDYWESISLFETQKQLPERIQRSIREERLRQTASGLSGSLRGMGTGVQPSLWERLEELNCPVWLIVGESDQKFVGIARDMYDQLPHVYLSVVSDAGHAVHVEQFDFFAKIIRDEVFPVIHYLNQN